MKTNKLPFLASIFFILTSCNSGYHKTPSGISYKIMSNATSTAAQPGEVIKIHVKQIYGDSILSDTRNFIPQYQAIDSGEMSADAFTIFKKVCVGDSIIFKAPADSTLKRKFSKIKSDHIETQIKVITIFANREAAFKDEDYEKQQLKEKYQPKP